MRKQSLLNTCECEDYTSIKRSRCFRSMLRTIHDNDFSIALLRDDLVLVPRGSDVNLPK